MPRSHRLAIAVVAGVMLAASAPAFAQSVLCKSTETQAECHTRLKCKADEELDACERRLMRCRAGEDLQDCRERRLQESRNNGGSNDGDRGDRDNDRGDRGDRGDRDNDRGDRGRDRDNDRGDRGDRAGDRDRGGRRGRDGGRSGRRRGDGGRGRRGGGGSHRFVANKTFGLGIELGEPSGLTGKVFFSERGAFDFGVGAIYRHYYYGDGLHLYGDVLFHPISLASTDAFELPFFIGGGIRFWNFEFCDRNVCGYDGSAIGLRIPLGIAFDFNRTPLDISLQLVPVIDFLDDSYYAQIGDRRHAGVDFSLGIRYWFK